VCVCVGGGVLCYLCFFFTLFFELIHNRWRSPQEGGVRGGFYWMSAGEEEDEDDCSGVEEEEVVVVAEEEEEEAGCACTLLYV
jgi:hypothetical protein